MDPATRERLQHMSIEATGFTPGWAIVRKPPPGRSSFEKLGMHYENEVPRPGPGERWTGSYAGHVAVAVTASGEGEPTTDADSANHVVVVDAAVLVTTTDQRMLGLAFGGNVCGMAIGDGRRILLALNFADVTLVRPLMGRSVFGAEKTKGVILACRGASLGAVRVTPLRGLNFPWDPQRRRVWGRGVVEDLLNNVQSAAPTAPSDISDSCRTLLESVSG